MSESETKELIEFWRSKVPQVFPFVDICKNMYIEYMRERKNKGGLLTSLTEEQIKKLQDLEAEIHEEDILFIYFISAAKIITEEPKETEI